MTTKPKKRAVSVMEMLSTKFKEMEFEGEWKELIGRPEKSGCWLVWGQSGSGKTSFLLQLSKYLTQFGRVAYNSIEEGVSKSLKDAIRRENMLAVRRRFLIIDKESISEIEYRLNQHKSPDIVVIDSVQYTELNRRTAKEFVDRHPNKLIIFVSHAEGKSPEGRTAKAIKYHANVKIFVEGYQAFINSRYGGDKSKAYTIWEEGAKLYYGTEINT